MKDANRILTQLGRLFGGETPGQAFDAIMDMRREGVTLADVRAAFDGTPMPTAAPKARCVAPGEGPYNDDTAMPWGKHRGTRLADVDPGYWRWLQKQDEPIRDKRLAAWLTARKGQPPRVATSSMDDPEEASVDMVDNPPMEGDDVPF